MIYGYLRVSSDEQDVNSQKQGVEAFAKDKGWKIDKYITDEGVSGGKDPDKRNLGPLLKQVNKDDIIICSEISRLGRDLYMVMDILHFCMERGCIIYTVKDRFVLGDDVQSKVLAFAFGLSAEIERQMIRQRTKEGLRLRMKLGILLGRPVGQMSREDSYKCEPYKDDIIKAFEWGAPIRAISRKVNIDRNTIYRSLYRWGIKGGSVDYETYISKLNKKHRENQQTRYKDTPYKVVDLGEHRAAIRGMIEQDMTLPQIAEKITVFTYEQIYDTVLQDEEFNSLYRKHGQLKIRKVKY